MALGEILLHETQVVNLVNILWLKEVIITRISLVELKTVKLFDFWSCPFSR